MKQLVYTIGHSTHATEKLIGLLARHHITAVADVRSQPYSRMNPQFNKENITTDLKGAGIAYVFLGRELGARTNDSSCYIAGKVHYDLLARTELFRQGLERIIKGMSTHQMALLCAEKDPLVCHRTILVARHLVAQSISVQHILETGALESHDAAIDRLLRELDLQEADLLRSRTEIVEEAYQRRGNEIAYKQNEIFDEGNVKGQEK
jgi:uncharacterized protein (DUF488 family)